MINAIPHIHIYVFSIWINQCIEIINVNNINIHGFAINKVIFL